MLSRIGYVQLCVPNIDQSLQHATELLGMRYVEERGGLHYLTCNARHHELVLRGGESARMESIGLEAVSEAALDDLCGRIEEYGVGVSEASSVAVDRAVRCVGPAGFPFELFVGMEESQIYPFDSIAVPPRKFGHVTVKCSQPEELEEFLCQVLGFRLSDRVPGLASWLRCGPAHHGLAIVSANTDGLHHYAFEVEGWSSIEAFCDHMSYHDVELIWGPGRHGPGRNLFTYHIDPAGAMVEVLADLQVVESELNYRPLEWEESTRTLNQWGPPPPADFFDYLIPIAASPMSVG